MLSIVFLELPQLCFARLQQPDPNKFWAVGRAPDWLIERDGAGHLAMAIEVGGDDAHWVGYRKLIGDASQYSNLGLRMVRR
jgi:hypothetical protein